MLRNFVSITSKIYQWDFPKEAVLKRSTKGAGHRTPCIQSSISKISTKMQWLGILFQVLTKFVSRLSQSSGFKALNESSNE